MRIHHLSCGTMCPYPARLIAGRGGWFAPGKICAHCLLIEGPESLILVDTGLGTRDVAEPQQLSRRFRAVIRPRLDERETAVAQVRRLGFEPGDVRDVVVTHLDVDHAGGLPDFPHASVHVFAPERGAIDAPDRAERQRYVPAHFAHGPKWSVHEVDGDEWLGFEAIRVIEAGEGELLLIPLVGHSRGHAGVAVRDGDGWLLHAGDAYFHRSEMEDPPGCPPGLRLFQSIMGYDNGVRRRNQERLRELARDADAGVRMFCAHDPVELERMRAERGYPSGGLR